LIYHKKLNKKNLFYLEIYIFYEIFQLTDVLWNILVQNLIDIYITVCCLKVSNYRPISLLSCVGKTFERVVFKHVSNYFLDNKLLCKYQSGFVRLIKSCPEALFIFRDFNISEISINSIIANFEFVLNSKLGGYSYYHPNLIWNKRNCLFDYSIQTSTFPDHWKLAKVMSLFKNGNRSLVSNYRPISLLSCVGIRINTPKLDVSL
jgi:hypothetical protein